MAKRGINIYKRRDGRYEGRYIKGHKPDRTPIYGSVYARKYNECLQKLEIMKAHFRQGRCIKKYGTGTVRVFMEYWLDNLMSQKVKKSTFSNYKNNLEKWIGPWLGEQKLERLEREEVQRFVNYLIGEELSAGTVANIFRVLKSAMKVAFEYEYVRHNPCDGVHLPEIIKKEARQLTKQEQKKLEKAALEDENGLPYLLALYTGVRIGELCALKKKDINLKEGILHVSNTIKRIQNYDGSTKGKTVLIENQAKSKSSVRDIPLTKNLIKLLREHLKHAEGEYVFSCNGHPLEPRTLQKRFKVLLRKAGIGDYNFHALRHTFATRCMELNIDIMTISALLGHASAKTTLDIYGHSQMEQKRGAIRKLSSYKI